MFRKYCNCSYDERKVELLVFNALVMHAQRITKSTDECSWLKSLKSLFTLNEIIHFKKSPKT